MKIKYEKHMLKLWKLTGEIGTLAETDNRYIQIYRDLSDALDTAENNKLIIYEEKEDK